MNSYSIKINNSKNAKIMKLLAHSSTHGKPVYYGPDTIICLGTKAVKSQVPAFMEFIVYKSKHTTYKKT